MELRDIEYFAVVAEHKSIGRAAEALNMSQPALSKSLRRLEQSMGAKVVQRMAKGVELTAVGKALLSQARHLRVTMDDIHREAVDLASGRAGYLRIGAGSALVLNLLPEAYDQFQQEAPKVTLKITVGGRIADTRERVRNGDLDLAVTGLDGTRHADLVEDHLYDEHYVAYASAHHRLAKRKRLALSELVNERWVLGATNSWVDRQLLEAFANKNLPRPIIAVETANLPLRQRMVSSSDLLAFGSNGVARHAAERYPIAVLQVKELGFIRRVGVLYRKDAYLSPAGRRFIQILKATAKKITSERR